MNAKDYITREHELYEELAALHRAHPKYENLRMTAHVTAYSPDDADKMAGGIVLIGKPKHRCGSCGCSYHPGTEITLTMNESLALAFWIRATALWVT